MWESRDAKAQKHRHRGHSSEGRLDKSRILSGLSITPGQVILDAGCGNGYMAKEFAQKIGPAGKVYAFDSDASAIETLKSETVGTNMEVFVEDITTETGLKGSSIDLIYIATVLHGFPSAQIRGFVTEAKRLLRPAGRLAVVEIDRDAPFGPPHEIRFSPKELRGIIDLAPAGLIHVGDFYYMQIFKKE